MSLLELVITIVVLAVGVLGLAGVTAFSVRHVTVSKLKTERAAALQTVIEQLRSMPLDSVRSGCDSLGVFEVFWTATQGNRSVAVEIVTEGPGLENRGGSGIPKVSGSVADTFNYVLR